MPSSASVLVGFCFLSGCELCNTRKNAEMLGPTDRKGAVRFLKDRLIHLGIPLAIYSWVINPLFMYVFFAKYTTMSFWDFFPSVYFSSGELIGQGPLWFVEVLLIFSLVYVVWRLVPSRSTNPAVETRFPSNSAIALFA
jgi:glucan biosynthesis protein C